MKPFVFSALLVAFSAQAHASLIITPQFDASITGDPNGAAIMAVINTAIGVYESTFANNITVNIYFQEGGGLGESDVGFVNLEPYQGFYNALAATDANPAAIAELTANAGNAAIDPVLGNSFISLKSANARALGLGGSGLCAVTPGDTNPASGVPGHCAAVTLGSNAVDGIISLNTGLTGPPGTPQNSYSLLGVTEHEIDEVLGLGSALGNTSSATATVGPPKRIMPEDLWRFDGNGNRASFTVNCANPGTAVFSIDGVTTLTGFNNSCNGADFGDWAASATAQVQDAFASIGSSATLGPNEIAALTVIGYQLQPVAAPEPSTFALLLGAVAVSALTRLRA